MAFLGGSGKVQEVEHKKPRRVAMAGSPTEVSLWPRWRGTNSGRLEGVFHRVNPPQTEPGRGYFIRKAE